MTDNMDVDMDIDLDLAVAEEDDEIARMQAEVDAINNATREIPAAYTEDLSGATRSRNHQAEEEGEINNHAIAPTKVHVRGVNDLTTRDVENFASDLYPSQRFVRVEWIDDTSVNLVYADAAAASEALLAFMASPTTDDAMTDADGDGSADEEKLFPARPLATHPHIELFVRRARESDRKRKGAAEKSEFYRANPQARKRRFDDFNYAADSGRPGRPPIAAAAGRYEDPDAPKQTSFSADMYDEAPESSSTNGLRPGARDLFARKMAGRRGGGGNSRNDVGPSRDRDLFADRSSREGSASRSQQQHSSHLRLRSDRSASPLHADGDGRYGFSESSTEIVDHGVAIRRAANRRPRSPAGDSSRRYSSSAIGGRSPDENLAARENLRAELFPRKRLRAGAPRGRSTTPPPLELFPRKHQADNNNGAARELFPDKTHHRRQDAKNLDPDEIADAIGSPYDHPLRGSAKKASATANSNRELFAHRISNNSNGRGAPATFSRARSVSLSDVDNFSVAGKAGFSIKGAGGGGGGAGRRRENGDRRRGDEDDEGFSIMGAGGGGRRNRGTGEGEDLFAGRSRGRTSALKG